MSAQTALRCIVSRRLDAAAALALGHHPHDVCVEFGHRPVPLVATARLEVAWCLRCGEVLQRFLDSNPTAG